MAKAELTNSEKNMELFVIIYLKEQIYVHPIYTYHIVVFCLCTFFRVKGVRIMVYNATINNISVTFWRSVLLVEETRVPGENH
jgi:hypothetical protein